MNEITTNRRLEIETLQASMMDHPDKILIEPRHLFAPGLYAREVTLPAGSTAIGHIHAQEHICIISKGRVLVVTEEGTTEISAPHTMIVPRGRKNCVHALEETIWTTIHATETRDIAALESELLLPTYPDEETPCLS
jgi:quercetin dioxygenase-like cupin family protein